MDTLSLLKLLASHPDVRRLADAVCNRKSDIVVDGLCGSSTALMLATLARGRCRDRQFVCILYDEQTAAYFYHDLTTVMATDADTPDCEVMFFPSSYRRAIKYNQRDEANEILRTKVLTNMGGDGWRFIVTHPEALAEGVMECHEMENRSIRIERGMEVDVTELEQRMLDLGFVRTDYVYEPGQYAVRGSIVDVFSYAGEQPFRLDFFGDEVDSIRVFDVQTQLSDGRCNEMTIVAEPTPESSNYVSMLSMLPQGVILLMPDTDYVAEKIRGAAAAGFTRQAHIEGGDTDTSMLIGADQFMADVAPMRKILTQTTTTSPLHIDFSTQPQPLYHKNFELVTRDFERMMLDGYSINIFADNEKQVRRLEDIFDANRRGEVLVTFTALPCAIHEGFIDHRLKQCFFTDHQLFDRYHKYTLQSERARRGKVALTLKEIQQFEIGDYVVHIDHGIGRFGGLVRVPNGDKMQEMIKIVYQRDDVVYVSIHALGKLSKYKGREGEAPRLSRLGTGAWERMKERVKTKVKDIARDLIRLYSSRMHEQGFAYSHDSYMQQELEASFVYEDTPDQLKTTQDVKADMESQHPMDRLVCGDVGFGKTEVAIRAAFKAATDSKQVAVLVPTTVLAYQHYTTFCDRLKDFPVRVEYLSRARDTKATKAVLADLAAGKVDIIIGTHKLIGKDVKFRDLGLLIIDEEQKFGVAVKEKLRQMKINVDTLTMTATPIPRTLQFSLMGARDMSIIQTPPPNRYPIQTEIHTLSPEIITEAINFEMSRNGQVFFVNNKISNLPELKALIERCVPDARVCIGHGRMNPQELEQVVFDFMNYDYDVMLSTTIIENGIDIPNANTIIINSAHNYGLSDLHQMRGRVGRSNKKAFCYLLAPPLAALPDDSRRRLQALENFSDLGSGIQIAMQDLDIRGAGNLLGAEQSGFIADLGYETYQKVLAEAMNELREEERWTSNEEQMTTDDGRPATGERRITNDDRVGNAVRLWAGGSDTIIESDLEAYFPDSYVPSSGERISLYRELDTLTSQQALNAYRLRLEDRFGHMPPEGEQLMAVMPMKWAAARLGIEKLVLKQGSMRMYLVADFESPYYQSAEFGAIIDYASWHPRETKIRELDGRRSVVVKDVTTMNQALAILQAMLKECDKSC